MRRFFVSSLPNAQSPTCQLSIAETHHLFRVVKIAIGEKVVLFDGKGHSCIATLLHTQGLQAFLQWERTMEEEDSSYELWLYICVLKQQAWSTSLRMATELGVHHIIPVVSQRTIVRKEKQERWESILLSSAKQCGGSRLPRLHPMVPFSSLYSLSIPNRYIFSPEQTEIKSVIPMTDHTALCIGPEGGFSSDEITAAIQHEWKAVGLGSRVLRADTAVCAALSLFLLS